MILSYGSGILLMKKANRVSNEALFFFSISTNILFFVGKLIPFMSFPISEKTTTNFKEIHIGNFIKQSVEENALDEMRICNFMQCSAEEISEMYKKPSLDSDVLLRWSKLLKYDFFRIYSHHLILYSPTSKTIPDEEVKDSLLPTFRKNIYTKEIIDFILERINSGEMTKNQVIEHYNIPKTTLYKWIQKYKD